MSDVMEYKCPACGGAMEFDSKTQRMKCPYCETEIAVDEFQSDSEEEEHGGYADNTAWQAVGGEQWQEAETKGMRVYVCESCAGEIVADETTGATSCPFCGNQVVMKGQFSGELRPDCIIPFKLDKKAAKSAYQKHLDTKGKDFLPKIFKQENHIDEIKGIYVPFWLYDADVYADIEYKAESSTTWSTGNTEYTETKTYLLHRAGNASFAHIPLDCSRKMDDTLMESIEPYDFGGAVPFQPAYLAGYLADRYDVELTERTDRVKERIQRSVEKTFRPSSNEFRSVTVDTSRVNITQARYLYALYPVWILNTTWQGKKYTFAMNGQTGKMVGDLPFDQGAFWKFVWKRGAVIGAVLYALMWALMLA